MKCEIEITFSSEMRGETEGERETRHKMQKERRMQLQQQVTIRYGKAFSGEHIIVFYAMYLWACAL